MSETNTTTVSRPAYATAAEADTLLSGRPDASHWPNLTSDVKAALLADASQRLDLCMKWSGTRVSTAQSLQWPRKNAVDKNGEAIAENLIPAMVKTAAIEEALRQSTPEFIASRKMAGSGISSASCKGMSLSMAADDGYICLKALIAAEWVGEKRSFIEVCGASGGKTVNGILRRS